MKTDMPKDYVVKGSTKFSYSDNRHIDKATVWMRFFICDEDTTVILLTDRSSTYVCASITNSIEEAATAIVAEYPYFLTGKIIWIEHYDYEPKLPRKRAVEETFDIVTFSSSTPPFEDPNWKRITREEAEKLTGSKIEAEA